jgi:two-component system nitrogen regulation response regulator NtrX
MKKILVVDDEENIGRSLKLILEREGYSVALATSIAEARARSDRPDLYMIDVRLPDGSGIDLVRWLKSKEVTAPIIMISGHGTIADAVEATHAGAFDFLEKPLSRDKVLLSLRHALEQTKLREENLRLKEQLGGARMIGSSTAFERVMEQATLAAGSDARILLTGESGTGKELLAAHVHAHSPFSNGPFVKVNCAAIPTELIESELFGHETQAKLLRVLQEGEFHRVGGEQPIRVSVRVISATNRDLSDMVAQQKFREDLYYRLCVVPLRVPALRERSEDVRDLAEYFLREFCTRNNFKSKQFAPAVFEAFEAYAWPGNIRELRNTVERMAILARGDVIETSSVPVELLIAKGARSNLREARETAEREHILKALDEAGWNVSGAARVLGMERTNLHKRIRALGLTRDKN